MKAISFHVQKGGVGKTTLIGTLGYLLAKEGKKVVLVDFDDSQGNLTTWLIGEGNKPTEFEIGDYFHSLNSKKLEPARNIKSVIVKDIRKNLDLAPTFGVGSSLKDYVISKMTLEEEAYSLDIFKEELEFLGYDYAIFDLSPAFKTLEKRMTLILDEVILSTLPTFFGIDGIDINNKENQKMRAVQDRRRKKPLIRSKIILNIFNKNYSDHLEANRNIQKAIKGTNIKLYKIRTATGINKAQKLGLFMGEKGTVDNGILEDYKEILKDIIREI